MKKTLSMILCLMVAVLPAFSYAGSISDLLDYSEKGDPVSFQAHLEIYKLPQFDEKRTEQLNRLLKHVDFSGTISEQSSEMAVLLDDAKLFSIMEFDYAGKKQAVLMPDESHTYIVPDNQESGTAMIPVSSDKAERIEKSLKMRRALDGIASWLQGMPEAFPDRVSRAKNTDKYKDYGTAASKVVLKITDEELNRYLQEHKADLAEMCKDPILEKIVFTGRQGFTFFFTAENRLLRVSYSGNAYWEEGEIRNIRLEWKTVRDNGYARDDLQLKTPDEKRTRRDNIILKYSWKVGEDGSEQFVWTEERDKLENRIRTQSRLEAVLSVTENRLQGTVTETVTENRRSNVKEIQIEAVAPDENSWTGTLEIIGKKDKIEAERLAAAFTLSSGVATQVSAAQPEMVKVSGEEFSRITEALYTEVVRKLIQLPAEDLAFLKEGIPEETWNTAVKQP